MRTKRFKKGDRIKWKNLYGIWQGGVVEEDTSEIFNGQSTLIRRHPPEDSEGIPNDHAFWVHTDNLEYEDRPGW